MSKLPGGDGAQESAIEVEQSQPGALRMVVGGQNDHLVAMHSDVADGFILLLIKTLRDTTRGLDRGDDLQVSVKEEQRVAASFDGLSDSICPLSLLVIVGKRRHRRQLIHWAVLCKFVQCSGGIIPAAHQESIVGERQAHGPIETLCGETAGLAGRQRLRVGIVARSDELHAARAVQLARSDRQHAAGQHAEAIRSLRHISQLSQTPRVNVAAPPQLPAVGMRPGGAHARGCVLGEPERAEELGQQVRRQQDIHAPQWERRHFGDEGVGLVLELGRALAGVHGEHQELSVREVGKTRRQAHETGGTERGSCGRSRRAAAAR
eukprot:scaffold81363_cov68-Phaeocystis_antarctica.AAC.3